MEEFFFYAHEKFRHEMKILKSVTGNGNIDGISYRNTYSSLSPPSTYEMSWPITFVPAHDAGSCSFHALPAGAGG
jgi:hypothetical protein